MAKPTAFSNWVHSVVDQNPEINGAELKRRWEKEHPEEDLPPHAASSLSQAKKRWREKGPRRSDNGQEARVKSGERTTATESDSGQQTQSGAAESIATLDRLLQVVDEYKQLKAENEDLKRRLNEIAGRLE